MAYPPESDMQWISGSSPAEAGQPRAQPDGLRDPHMGLAFRPRKIVDMNAR
jgi:hypothetical protein